MLPLWEGKQGGIKNKLMNDQEFAAKRAKYCQWLAKNPPIFDEDTGDEMKECQGCYCQLFADSRYDFCSDCIVCDAMSCGNSDPYLGGCCACYGKKIGDPKLKRKKLTFSQRQRLNWEQVKKNAKDKIEQIKDSDQDKKRTLESLSVEELQQEIERKKNNHE